MNVCVGGNFPFQRGFQEEKWLPWSPKEQS